MVPKSQWGPGPWQDEPAALDWCDQTTGYACAIRRHPELGHLCGYVGVPPGHALHGWQYEDDVPLREDFEKDGKYGAVDLVIYALSGARAHGTIPLGLALKAHGGVNWSDARLPDDRATAGLWWFGFDCGHAGDFLPGVHATLKRIHIDQGTTRTFAEREKHFGLGAQMPWGEAVTYRTVEYVKTECATLALQLAQLEKIVLAPSIELTAKKGE